MTFDDYFAQHSIFGPIRTCFALECVEHILPLTTNAALTALFRHIAKNLVIAIPFLEFPNTKEKLEHIRDNTFGSSGIGDNISYWLTRSMIQLVSKTGNLHRVTWPLQRATAEYAVISAWPGDYAHSYHTAMDAEAGWQLSLAHCFCESRQTAACHPRFSAAVKGLARTIDEEGDFSLMGILGDALEECGEYGLAGHCHEPVHGRGCAVLRMINHV